MAEVTVTDTPPQATDLAADRVAEAIGAGRADGRPVHLSVAGGNTPRATYHQLARLVDDWNAVELWLGDERMVPLDDPESNYRLLDETLLRQTGALAHPVPTEGSAEDAASAYAREIRRRVPAGPDGVPVLDLAFLGLGEDGHTASLFPHAPALSVRGEVCVAVHDAPKPPPDRISLTLDVLQAARRSLILAVGEGKASAVAGVVSGPDPGVPASLLADGPLELIVDRTAAQELP
ncbi:MAG: 6-phosphogluconolactonase [Actinobacteria bacterium 13_1_20CM_3_68_9]|nr:MAG: 6-phosphogluconolactonase [Actinobacteria bacterium 13_1_20CM_3_68_9]